MEEVSRKIARNMDVQQQFLHKKRRDKSKTTSSRQKVLLTVECFFFRKLKL
jgi:hypothetical protein